MRYIAKTFWLANLAVVYTYPSHWPTFEVLGAVLLIGILSLGFILRLRSEPFLAVGWLWFLGALVPTIGLIQVGGQSMADRYMYIPSIGPFIVLVWGLTDLLARWSSTRELAGRRILAPTCIGCNY